MLFGKKKKDQPKQPTTIREALDGGSDSQVEITESEVGSSDEQALGDQQELSDQQAVKAADESAERSAEEAAQETTEVPRDVNELSSRKGYLDFGAILIPAGKDQKVRLDIDQKTKRVVSLTIAVDQASIQLQAFSAPKSGGIWEEVRGQIEESVVKQKGRVKRVDGRFGKEVHARVPTVLKDGRKGWRAARFIGFEGKRWFLRGVIGGRGAIDREASQGVEELFSKIVVVRGDEPLPPRELLKLQAPEGAKRVTVPGKGQEVQSQKSEGASTPSRRNGVAGNGQQANGQS